MRGYKTGDLESSWSRSLSLPASYKHLTDLIVGGGSAGQPPEGLSCFAGQDTDEWTSLMMPRHRIKNCINNWRRLWERRCRSYKNKSSERWPVIRGILHQGKETAASLGLYGTDLSLREAHLYSIFRLYEDRFCLGFLSIIVLKSKVCLHQICRHEFTKEACWKRWKLSWFVWTVCQVQTDT